MVHDPCTKSFLTLQLLLPLCCHFACFFFGNFSAGTLILIFNVFVTLHCCRHRSYVAQPKYTQRACSLPEALSELCFFFFFLEALKQVHFTANIFVPNMTHFDHHGYSYGLRSRIKSYLIASLKLS